MDPGMREEGMRARFPHSDLSDEVAAMVFFPRDASRDPEDEWHFEDAEAARPPSSRPQTRVSRPDTASGSWMVRVFSAGDAVVCTAERSAATTRGSCSRSPLNE